MRAMSCATVCAGIVHESSLNPDRSRRRRILRYSRVHVGGCVRQHDDVPGPGHGKCDARLNKRYTSHSELGCTVPVGLIRDKAPEAIPTRFAIEKELRETLSIATFRSSRRKLRWMSGS